MLSVVLVIYKIVALVVGLLFGFMGYRLFMAGIWGNSGTVQGDFGDTNILIKRAAPGTFFAVAGVIITCTAILTGITTERTIAHSSSSDTSLIEKPILPENPMRSN